MSKSLKCLFLVQDEQKIILEHYYNSLKVSLGNLVIRRLNSKEQANLELYFEQNIETSKYDRIIIFLRFKKELAQVDFIQTIPNLIILEHDSYQNYMKGCKYKGKFTKYYSQLVWAKILVSGYTVCQKLQAEGFDANFVPKGYDSDLLIDLGKERTVECGFIGGLKNSTYKARRKFLEGLVGGEIGLEIMQTTPGNDYLETMNKIKFFISADIGFGEYMIKNFEAMACGCILFTYSHGSKENSAIGFEDLKNVVLYNSKVELLEKLNILRSDKVLSAKIAKAGTLLAQNYTWDKIAQKAASVIEEPLRTPVLTKGFFGRVKADWS
ncbi:MAG: glycosyltransferase [Lentisphaeraceae bacterium]|nr:glycosyltransferase [Lentisphaeraceae bacterium]